MMTFLLSDSPATDSTYDGARSSQGLFRAHLRRGAYRAWPGNSEHGSRVGHSLGSPMELDTDRRLNSETAAYGLHASRPPA